MHNLCSILLHDDGCSPHSLKISREKNGKSIWVAPNEASSFTQLSGYLYINRLLDVLAWAEEPLRSDGNGLITANGDEHARICKMLFRFCRTSQHRTVSLRWINS